MYVRVLPNGQLLNLELIQLYIDAFSNFKTVMHQVFNLEVINVPYVLGVGIIFGYYGFYLHHLYPTLDHYHLIPDIDFQEIWLYFEPSIR